MSALYAMFDDGDSAQRAVNGLRQAGLADADITIVTALPIEDQEFGEIDKTTWIWYIACAGAFLGFCGSTWLTRMTELAWPLQTGNMPIVAWWPNLIVIFEMTMLGSILATVITLIVSAGLGRRMPRLYDPEVTRRQDPGWRRRTLRSIHPRSRAGASRRGRRAAPPRLTRSGRSVRLQADLNVRLKQDTTALSVVRMSCPNVGTLYVASADAS